MNRSTCTLALLFLLIVSFPKAYSDTIYPEPSFGGAIITEEALRSLSLQDPELCSAYVIFFSEYRFPWLLRQPGRPELKAIYSDVARRGDSATPLILDIMKQDKRGTVEYLALRHLLLFPEIDKEPYINYIRERLRTGGNEIDSITAGIFGSFLSEFGTLSDIDLIINLTKKRPELGSGVEQMLPKFADRIETSEERRIRIHGIGRGSDSTIEKPKTEKQPVAVDPSIKIETDIAK